MAKKSIERQFAEKLRQMLREHFDKQVKPPYRLILSKQSAECLYRVLSEWLFIDAIDGKVRGKDESNT